MCFILFITCTELKLTDPTIAGNWQYENLCVCVSSHRNIVMFVHLFTHTLAAVPELWPNRIMNSVRRGGVKADVVRVCVCACVQGSGGG